jgi:hypothetical protein
MYFKFNCEVYIYRKYLRDVSGVPLLHERDEMRVESVVVGGDLIQHPSQALILFIHPAKLSLHRCQLRGYTNHLNLK